MKIFLIIIILLLIDFAFAKNNKKPRIIYREKLKNNFNALTFPPLFIYICSKDKNNSMLRNHELIHWKQYQRTGFIIYYIRYFFEIKYYGYDKSPMEIEARIESGEREECVIDYTKCVRSGLALTVHDINFRKNK